MTAVFAKILLMGLSAGILVAVVLVLRLFTGKVSKKLTCLLWALVAVRLVCPVSLQTPFSLMPTLPAVTEFAEPTAAPVITPADPTPAVTVDPVTPVTPVSPATPATTATPTKTASPVSLLTLFAAVWLAGMVSLLLYGVLSAFLVRRRMLGAVRKEDNVWQSDRVGSPFILGVLRPRIYLPFTLSETATAAVLAHERTHLKRGDHLVKPLAWLLLSVYWFNPLLWVAYILLCRDIESACDEKVVKGMEEEERKVYATALLDCGISQSRRLAVCPLAFGEVKIKQRVRDVMNYRRPAFWLILVAVLLALTAAVFFLTDRVSAEGTKSPTDPTPSETPTPILEDPTPSEGLRFILTDDETGYLLSSVGTCTDKDIVVPSTYNGKPVTGVGKGAFLDSDIRTIRLPDTVTMIGGHAFLRCLQLERVDAPGVTTVGERAFSSCLKLSFVRFGKTITLGESAFSGCKALTNFPTDTIIEMGEEVFSVCPVGETFDYPRKILFDEELGMYFTMTNDLAGWRVRLDKGHYKDVTDVTIPASYAGKPVVALYHYALPLGSDITRLTLPASIRTIEKNAITMFGGKITFLGTKAQWNAIEKEEGWLVGFAGRIVCSDGDEETGRASAVRVPGEGIAVPVSAELIRAATFTDFNTERVLTGEEIKRLAVLFAGSEVIDLDGGTTPDYRLDISFTDGTSMTLYDCEDRLEVVFFDENHAVLGEEDAEYKLINDGLVDFLKGFLNE